MRSVGRDGDAIIDARSLELRLDRGEALRIQIHLDGGVVLVVDIRAQVDRVRQMQQAQIVLPDHTLVIEGIIDVA